MQPQCSELTAKGERCRSRAVEGSDRCVAHLRRNGAKTILTTELADRLVAALRAGNYVNVSCAACGISRRTFADWMQRGEKAKQGDELYVRLRARVEEARAQGEVRNVAQIMTAAQTSWQAAAWLLERQYPDRWGRPSVRLREEDIEGPVLPAAVDPFAEVDELAARRRRGT